MMVSCAISAVSTMVTSSSLTPRLIAASVSDVEDLRAGVSRPAGMLGEPELDVISDGYLAWITSILRNQRGVKGSASAKRFGGDRTIAAIARRVRRSPRPTQNAARKIPARRFVSVHALP
jgi:hypothetical protein